MHVWLKKIRQLILISVGAYLLLELAALSAFFIKSHSWFSPVAFKEKAISVSSDKSQVLSAQGDSDFFWVNTVEAIHPYVGFIIDPYRNRRTKLFASEFGFVSGDQSNPIMKRSSDKIIIGLFGGSVALGVYMTGFEKAFSEFSSLTNKEVVILNFSAGGYKQPQQFLILSYLLSLGAEFDIVVNLDGFNEVALPYSENLPTQVYPFYPRRWDTRTKSMIDIEQIKQLGYVEYLKTQRAEIAAFFVKYRLYYSPTLGLLWQYQDAATDRLIYDLRMEVAQKKGSLGISPAIIRGFRREKMPEEVVGKLEALQFHPFDSKETLLTAIEDQIGKQDMTSYRQKILKVIENDTLAQKYVSHGPNYSFIDDEHFFADLTDVWKKSSLQMKRLCESNQIKYFHFLQPNQYVKGSKIMTAAEEKIAIMPDNPSSQGVVKGYPKLRQAGAELSQQGVNFTDLTMFFASDNEVLYSDTCCHFNIRGYQLILDKISLTIAPEIKNTVEN